MTESAVISMILTYANIFGVNPSVAVAVARQESGLRPSAISRNHRDIGLFQLNLSSYPAYTKKDLLNPQFNAMLGILHLRNAKETCVHKEEINWLVCFNFGQGNAKKVKHPHLFPYVKRVRYLMSKYH